MWLRNEGTAPSHFLCVSPPPSLGCTGVYFIVCMALLVISLAETILIVRLVHKQDLQQPVPAWLQHLVLERVTLLLCLGEQLTSQRPPATSQATKTHDCSGERGKGRVPHEGAPSGLEAGMWWRVPEGRAMPGNWVLSCTQCSTPGLVGRGQTSAKGTDWTVSSRSHPLISPGVDGEEVGVPEAEHVRS